MSGPKCNQYALNEEFRRQELKRAEEEARRRVEEERRRKEEEARLREEQKKAERQERSKEFNADVEDRVQRLKERLYKKREQEIVAHAIDEAMMELGYDLIASDVPKEDDDEEMLIQAQVFSFSEGVGVQVVENGGRISMEIVGLGTSSRRPTDMESEYIEGQMVSFCDTFGVLEKKLEEKGVVKVGAIRHLSPSKKYARILNVDEFSERKEVSTLQSVMKKKESQKTTEGKSIAVKKQMTKRTE